MKGPSKNFANTSVPVFGALLEQFLDFFLYPFGDLFWLNCPTAGDQDWIHVFRQTKAISLDVPVQVVAGTNETLQYVIDID